MVDALFRFFAILLSWPLVGILVVIMVRQQPPKLISDLSARMTKAPGGFEFATKKELEEVSAKVDQKLDAVNLQVERFEQRRKSRTREGRTLKSIEPE